MRFTILAILFCSCLFVTAQGVLIHKDNSSTYYSSVDVDSMVFVEDTPVDCNGNVVLDVEEASSIRDILLLFAANNDNVQLTRDGMLEKMLATLDAGAIEIRGGG